MPIPPSKEPDPTFPCALTIHIPLPTPRLANIALRALSVDQELSPLVRRAFTLTPARGATETQTGTETVLTTHYTASTDRMLRVAVNGFFESVGVMLAAMRELDEDVVGEGWVGDGGTGGEVDGLGRVQGLEEGGSIG